MSSWLMSLIALLVSREFLWFIDLWRVHCCQVFVPKEGFIVPLKFNVFGLSLAIN